MTARIPDTATNPDVTTGVKHLYKGIYAAGVPQQILELIHLRASQINGCSFCVDSAAKGIAKAGMSTEKVIAVAAWHFNPVFDDAERAVLALTEAATRLADRPGAVTDEIWNEAAKHFNERQLNAIVMMVGLSNFFNRVNTTLRIEPGTAWN